MEKDVKLKIFVSGKFDREKIKELMKQIEGLGHTITYDWTYHIPIKPYINNQALAQTYCKNEIKGIMDADLLFFLSHEQGTTLMMEYGAALAKNLIDGKPAIYVIGKHNSRSPWFFHPNVKRIDDVEQALKEIAELTK